MVGKSIGFAVGEACSKNVFLPTRRTSGNADEEEKEAKEKPLETRLYQASLHVDYLWSFLIVNGLPWPDVVGLNKSFIPSCRTMPFVLILELFHLVPDVTVHYTKIRSELHLVKRLR